MTADQVQAAPRRSIRTSSLGLVLGKSAQMASGFLFWLVAAQFATTRDFGLTATMVSAVMLCALVGSLGVGAALIRHLPHAGAGTPGLLASGTTLVVVAAAASAGLLLLATNLGMDELHEVAVVPALAGLFVVTSVLGAVNVLLDQVSMAVGRGEQVLVRNIAGAGIMIACLYLLVAVVGAPLSTTELFACWVVAGACVTLVGWSQVYRALSWRTPAWAEWSTCRSLMGTGGPNYVLTLTERAPSLLLPVLVTELMSPTQTAHWYPVWMMAWAVFVMPTSVGIALFAEAAHGAGRARRALWRSLRWSLQLGGAAALVLALLAEPLLALLGDDFADAGAVPLRILMLGLVPLVFTQTYFSIARAVGRMKEVIVVGVVSAFLTVGVTLLGGHEAGLVGMAIAWVGVQVVVGAWSAARLFRARWVRVQVLEVLD